MENNKKDLLIKGELDVGLTLRDITCTIGAKVEIAKTSPIERDQLNKTYQKELHNQVCNWRNPDQIAAITWEDMPMDMICAKATAKVIGDIMKCSVKLKVYCHDDLRYVTTSDGQGSQDLMIIRVKLSENHFTSETSDVQPSPDQRNQNDCLYQCLLPEIKQQISPIEFRDRIANEIEKNPNASRYIKNGVPNEESTEYDSWDRSRFEPDKLVKSRLKNGQQIEVKATKKEFYTEDQFLEFSEFFNNISLLTGIPVHEVVDHL